MASPVVSFSPEDQVIRYLRDSIRDSMKTSETKDTSKKPNLIKQRLEAFDNLVKENIYATDKLFEEPEVKVPQKQSLIRRTFQLIKRNPAATVLFTASTVILSNLGDVFQTVAKNEENCKIQWGWIAAEIVASSIGIAATVAIRKNKKKEDERKQKLENKRILGRFTSEFYRYQLRVTRESELIKSEISAYTDSQKPFLMGQSTELDTCLKLLGDCKEIEDKGETGAYLATLNYLQRKEQKNRKRFQRGVLSTFTDPSSTDPSPSQSMTPGRGPFSSISMESGSSKSITPSLSLDPNLDKDTALGIPLTQFRVAPPKPPLQTLRPPTGLESSTDFRTSSKGIENEGSSSSNSTRSSEPPGSSLFPTREVKLTGSLEYNPDQDSSPDNTGIAIQSPPATSTPNFTSYNLQRSLEITPSSSDGYISQNEGNNSSSSTKMSEGNLSELIDKIEAEAVQLIKSESSKQEEGTLEVVVVTRAFSMAWENLEKFWGKPIPYIPTKKCVIGKDGKIFNSEDEAKKAYKSENGSPSIGDRGKKKNR